MIQPKNRWEKKGQGNGGGGGYFLYTNTVINKIPNYKKISVHIFKGKKIF